MKKTKKKLFRSKKNRILTGVLGGIGEMIEVDPTIIRIIYLILTALLGFVPGIVVYVITSLIVPEKKEMTVENVVTAQRPDPEKNIRQIAFIIIFSVLVLGLVIVVFSKI